MTAKQTKVLVVSPDTGVKVDVCRILIKHGFNAIMASNGQAALSLFEKNRPDILITEYQLPDLNGDRLVDQLKNSQANLPVVFLAGQTTNEVLVNMIKYEQLVILKLPTNEQSLTLAIQYVLNTQSKYDGNEKRKFRRIKTRIPIRLGNGKEATISNLSVGGAFVETTEDLGSVNETLHTQIPDLGGLNTMSTVVWKGNNGLGLRFNQLEPEELSKIGKFIFDSLKGAIVA
ncbi:MAG: response regulator [Bacteriovoracia bacterium]